MVDSENVSILSASDLAMVLLVRADDSGRSMPTVRPREIGAVVEELASLGIRAVKMFASGDTRDCTGSRGKASDSLMARAIREVKAAHSSVIVMTETCLCSYTDSGECHLIDRAGRPDRLAAIEAIAEQAVAQAAAGADVVGPAAMINGSVSCVRRALDETGHSKVQIMPHLIFDSRLYDAYRQTMDAAPASGERRVFQIDPARPETAVRASLGFVDEGADMLLLEPALFCGDVPRLDRYPDLPQDRISAPLQHRAGQCSPQQLGVSTGRGGKHALCPIQRRDLRRQFQSVSVRHRIRAYRY